MKIRDKLIVTIFGLTASPMICNSSPAYSFFKKAILDSNETVEGTGQSFAVAQGDINYFTNPKKEKKETRS